jgi:hypothetical protein
MTNKAESTTKPVKPVPLNPNHRVLIQDALGRKLHDADLALAVSPAVMTQAQHQIVAELVTKNVNVASLYVRKVCGLTIHDADVYATDVYLKLKTTKAAK